MKLIAAAKLTEQCLAILDDVGEEGIVITKRGKAVAKLLPIRAASSTLIGCLRGKLEIKGRHLHCWARLGCSVAAHSSGGSSLAWRSLAISLKISSTLCALSKPSS